MYACRTDANLHVELVKKGGKKARKLQEIIPKIKKITLNKP